MTGITLSHLLLIIFQSAAAKAANAARRAALTALVNVLEQIPAFGWPAALGRWALEQERNE